MKITPAVALLLASSQTNALNMKGQKATKSLVQKDNTARALVQVQQPVIEYTQANFEAGWLPFKPIPANYDMGPNPQWIVLMDKWNDPIPEGYYLPDEEFVIKNKEALMAFGDANIGEWSIIAYYGGQMGGSKYNYELVCKDGCIDDPLYDVYGNEGVSDVLLVAADPEHPGCDIEGYDCTCVKKPPVDPFTRKPIPCDSSSYTAYTRNQVADWQAYKQSLGYNSVDGWLPEPTKYIGAHIYLDDWFVFGGEDWEEWRFGIEIYGPAGNAVDWPIIAGIAFMNNEGRVVYEFVVPIPDMPEVMPGETYQFVMYNQNAAGNQCSIGEAFGKNMKTFTIGEPYDCMIGYNCYDTETDIIKGLWEFADSDNNQCVSYEEMIALFNWGKQDADSYSALVDAYFDGGDANADGLITWDEFNDWLATVEYAADGQKMEEGEKDAMRSFFQYFDAAQGNGDKMLTRDEAFAGTLDLAEKIGYFYEEFNYYWQFFNVADDECVMLNELEEKIDDAYDVTEMDINYYWIQYYWTVYSVTEYYWWIYRMPNGGFNWDGYYSHVPDGPAFDGASWLYFDESTGYTQTVYIWYLDSFCYFSLNFVGNSDASQSGECTIENHKNVGTWSDGGWTTDEIIFYFGSDPTHAVKFFHQVEEWGPVEYMTEERYYADVDGIWMWQKPDTYCEVCDDVADWTVIPFNAQSIDFTYGYDTVTIGYNDDEADGGLYQTGEGYVNNGEEGIDFYTETGIIGVDENGNAIVPPDMNMDGVDENGNMIVAPDVEPMYGIDEDGNQIVSPEVYYESYSYSETSTETGMETVQLACTNDDFQDANGGCDYYESSMVNPGDEALICPMSADFALMDGITAQACCDVCAGF